MQQVANNAQPVCTDSTTGFSDLHDCVHQPLDRLGFGRTPGKLDLTLNAPLSKIRAGEVHELGGNPLAL